MARRTALDWARRQGEWVEQQLALLRPAEPFVPGGVIPLEGQEVRLIWDPAAPRSPTRAGGAIHCGGLESSFAARIERFLRAEARARLAERTAIVAASGGVTVGSVTVGDASSRWGSCSASGAIRYNWRLILAPPHLLDWVVAHEVAHRRHMDHGPRFKALERELYGADVAAARAELRALGPRLKRIGRSI